MPTWKPGDRVKVISRKQTEADRETNQYFPHMAHLTGTVAQVFSKDEVAVRVDEDAMPKLLADVHTEAVRRMRAKFIESLGEEQRRKLSKEERQFSANFVLLLRSADLEKGPKAPPKAQPSLLDDDEEEYDGTSVRTDVPYDDASVPDQPKRKTKKELAAAEAAELKKRRN